jgi:hypothetical protein
MMKASEAMMRKFLTIFSISLCVLIASRPASAGTLSVCGGILHNVVANCGFETGDFTSWNLSGNDVPVQAGLQYGVEGIDPLDSIAPNSGNYQTFVADLVSNATTISQAIATNPNTSYLITWYFAQDTDPVAPYSNLLTVTFGGHTVFNGTGMGQQGYTMYSYFAPTASASTQLAFTIGNDLGQSFLDDVSVTPSPEPGTWLFALGAGAMLLGRKARP